MFLHERSLVTKYEGRPFVLLGVDEDEQLEALQHAQKKNHLNWRSWWDNGGLIASRWQAQGLPTLFLIDHKGMIRRKLVGSPSNPRRLEEMIEQLVKEAESDLGRQASLRKKW